MRTLGVSGGDTPSMITRRPDPAERGYARLFYRNWRPTRTGRWVNRVEGWWAALGLPPRIMVALEVRGRTSGRTRRSVLVTAKLGRREFLVSMLGDGSDWVRNARAAGGRAVIRHWRPRQVRLVEIPAAERAPVLQAYCRVAPGGRMHFPLAPDAPLEEFAKIAADYPVFRIDPR